MSKNKEENAKSINEKSPKETDFICKPNKISKKGNTGNALSAQTRAVVYNVLQYAFREKKAKTFLMDINKAMDRVAAMTGLCRHTLCTIKKEGSSNGGVWENKVWTKRKKIITNPTDTDKINIINKIEEFEQRNEHITLRKLHSELKQENKFSGGRSSLQIVLTLLGYKWKKTESNTNKKVLQRVPIIEDTSKSFSKKKTLKRKNDTLQQVPTNNFSPICDIEESGLKHCAPNQKFVEYQQPVPMQDQSHLQGPMAQTPSNPQLLGGPYDNLQRLVFQPPDYIYTNYL